MNRMFKAVSLGIVTALLGAFIYFFVAGFELEESMGLDALFKVRGPIAAPIDSVVVAIDKTSSDYFGLENEPQSGLAITIQNSLMNYLYVVQKPLSLMFFSKNLLMLKKIKHWLMLLKKRVMLFYLVN